MSMGACLPPCLHEDKLLVTGDGEQGVGCHFARFSPWAGQAPQEVHQGGLDLVPEVVQALEQVEGGDVEGMAGNAQSM